MGDILGLCMYIYIMFKAMQGEPWLWNIKGGMFQVKGGAILVGGLA